MEPTLISIEEQNKLIKEVKKNVTNIVYCVELLDPYFKDLMEFEYMQKRQELKSRLNQLLIDIMSLWEYFEDLRNAPNPFNIVHSAPKVAKLYKSIAKHKNDPDFYTIILMAAHTKYHLRGDIILTEEHLKVLDVKYIK